MIALKDWAFCDVERELRVTRRVLERLPESQFDWQPHAKSMTLGKLAMHVATLPQWLADTLLFDVLDFAHPPVIRQASPYLKDVLEEFDKQSQRARDAIVQMTDDKLVATWTMRQGETMLYSAPRIQAARAWCANHLVHHRSQLCVMLRLLDQPVPAVYFNSSDEPGMVLE